MHWRNSTPINALHCFVMNHYLSSFPRFFEALEYVYQQQVATLKEIFVNAPRVSFEKRDSKPEELEQDLQVAVLKMQSELWIEGRLLHFRAQYIEYSQITLERVGEGKHQSPVVRRRRYGLEGVY